MQEYYFNNESTFGSLFGSEKMNAKLTYKIRVKKNWTRADGTNAVYLSIYYDGDRKRLPLGISVPMAFFDDKKQRVKPKFKYAADYNLVIEKTLADLNKIEIGYRLNEEAITLKKVVEDLLNPSIRLNFNAFAENLLSYQIREKIIADSTHRQQKATLNKIKNYKEPLFFSEINSDFLNEFKSYMKNKLNNKKSTIEGTVKNFKKYLHAANKRGIKTELKHTDIKVGKMQGEYIFLIPEELKTVYSFYNSEFINDVWKNILQRYLFSCFTGLRISDIENIGKENFFDDVLVFNAQKTGKIIRINLNKTAMKLINPITIFNGKYTREHINRELKNIAKACGIKKRLHYHSSRHTFATNYLLSGGQVQNLQKIMGHSKIETTMIYVHIVEGIMNKEIKLMDDIVS